MATSLTEVTELTVKPLQVKVSDERGLRTKHSNEGPENRAAPFNVGPFSEKSKWLESRNEDHMSLYGERIYKARNRACNDRLDIRVGATSEKNVRSSCLNEVHMSQGQGLDTRDPRMKRYHISSAESPRKRVYNSPFSCLDTHHLKKTLSEPDISPRRRAADMELRPSKTTQELKTRWDKSSQNSPSLARNRNSRQSILKKNSFNNNNNNNNISSNNNNNNNISSNNNNSCNTNSINDNKAQVQPENFYGLYTKQISVGPLQRKQFGSSHSQKPMTLSSQILSRYKVHNKPTLPSKPIKLEPTKLEPSSSLSLKSLTVYLPQLTSKTNPRDDPALILAPYVQESRTSGNIDDQPVTEKQPKQESRSQEGTSVPVLTTDAKSLAKCSKTPESRLTLAEQLYHYKKDIDLTRWMCEQHLEIVRRTLKYKPLRLVVISSKISSKQLLIDALTPNTVDLIYDYDSLTPSELIDAVQKKLDGKRVESLLLMCKGGPGYMYLLKNQAVTPAKIKNSRDTRLIWFWISLQTVMSKIQSESVQASVHLWVPRLTHNQQHHPLQHDLQQLLKPYKIHVEAVSWSNGQGASVLGQYFTINSLSLWLQQQQQYLDDDDDDEDDDEQILQQILNPDNNLKQQIL